jgi:serine/threonine-protein kinase
MDYPMSAFHVAIAVCIAFFGSRIIYGMGTELGRAQAMGSYTLESVLGEGGMGEVWRAKHALLARPAALKLIRPSMLEDLDPSVARGYKVRFEREAQVTANLQSPHTVDLFDFGTTADGTFYYAMELLDGLDMHCLVQRFGPVPPERAIWFLVQACHSLGEAHRAGLVHRDIKPANLMVCSYGGDADFVKVLDFGVVAEAPERRDTSQEQLTAVGSVAGTPQYMAPEVARGQQADASSDIYALGCVAYMLLSGHKVFYEPTPQAVLAAHAYKSPTPLRDVAHQELPDPLVRVIMSCLEKEKEYRPRSAEELARQLGDIELASPWSQERARQWWKSYRPVAVDDDHRPDPFAGGSALPKAGQPEEGSSPTIQETPAAKPYRDD